MTFRQPYFLASLFGAFLVTSLVISTADILHAESGPRCNPWTDQACSPASAVDVMIDYIYYIKNVERGKARIGSLSDIFGFREKLVDDDIYNLFARRVKEKMPKSKFSGILEKAMDSSLVITNFTVDASPGMLDNGEAECDVRVEFTYYPMGMMTMKSLTTKMHAVYEDGEWRLSRMPSFSHQGEYQGLFP